MRHSMLALALLAAPVAAEPISADRLGWLAGDWVQQAGPTLTEESWLPPRGGMLLGLNRTSRNGAARAFEFIRIGPGPDGRLSFNAQPNGAPPTAFPAVEQTDASILFLNPAHDYPQRIRYWREGDMLMAEISLADGSKPDRWRFERRR
jgi:hypothetical protein